ncbi:MAG: Gfo/Idh/MocA family oxidoreductase [Oscillospiraceae bacterium]|nr:Gfo/Idh/MocA family oxidoreductase [Oscillospiraceae bacterium]
MNIGVVGAGAISDIYLKNLTTLFPNTKVISVCANHIENAQKKADMYGLEAVTMEDMLKDPRIELMVILTPVGTHADLIRQCLNAGKHVYSEKTLAETSKGANDLLKLAKQKGLYLGCAPDTFLGSSFQSAKRMLDGNKIGDVLSFSISVNRNNDFLTALFPFLRQPGAGALRDYLVYFVTALVYLLGPAAEVAAFSETPFPVRVGKYPQFSNYGEETETPNESVVSAIVKLKNGITGSIHENNESNMKEQCRFTLYGTNGILSLGNPNNFGDPVTLFPADYQSSPEILVSDLPFSENSRGVGVAELVSAISQKRTALTDASLARHVLEILEGMEKSAAKRRFVKITSDFPTMEQFSKENLT